MSDGSAKRRSGAQRERAGAGRARRGGLGLLAAGGGRGGRAPHEHAREEPDRHQQRDDQDRRQAAGLPRGPPLGDGVVGRPGPRPAAGSTTGIASVGASSTSVCAGAGRPRARGGYVPAARLDRVGLHRRGRRSGRPRSCSAAGSAQSRSAAGRVAGIGAVANGSIGGRGSRRARADRRARPSRGDAAPAPARRGRRAADAALSPGRVADLVGAAAPHHRRVTGGIAAPVPRHPRTPNRRRGSPSEGTSRVGAAVRLPVSRTSRAASWPPSCAADADLAGGSQSAGRVVGGSCGAAVVPRRFGAAAPGRVAGGIVAPVARRRTGEGPPRPEARRGWERRCFRGPPAPRPRPGPCRQARRAVPRRRPARGVRARASRTASLGAPGGRRSGGSSGSSGHS